MIYQIMDVLLCQTAKHFLIGLLDLYCSGRQGKVAAPESLQMARYEAGFCGLGGAGSAGYGVAGTLMILCPVASMAPASRTQMCDVVAAITASCGRSREDMPIALADVPVGTKWIEMLLSSPRCFLRICLACELVVSVLYEPCCCVFSEARAERMAG